MVNEEALRVVGQLAHYRAATRSRFCFVRDDSEKLKIDRHPAMPSRSGWVFGSRTPPLPTHFRVCVDFARDKVSCFVALPHVRILKGLRAEGTFEGMRPIRRLKDSKYRTVNIT